jgi:uncharacterized protein (DUF1697 family)
VNETRVRELRIPHHDRPHILLRLWYRRQMKAIGYFGKVEKRLGTTATTRNWNTIQKIMQILNDT